MELHILNYKIVIAALPFALVALFSLYVKLGEMSQRKAQVKHKDSHGADA